MKSSCAMLLCLLVAVTSSRALCDGASRLTTTKNSIQFEIEQKEQLLKKSILVTEALKALRRARMDDQHILKALELKDICKSLQDTIRTATARQAITQEEIAAALKLNLSAQENTEYRNFNLVLMELASVQGKLLEKLSKDVTAVDAYLKNIPAPEELALPFGLSLKLVRDASTSTEFYVSMPLTNSLAAKYLPALQLENMGAPSAPANLNFIQAKAVVEAMADAENVKLALPSTACLEALSQSNIHPGLAVWSAEPFSNKNSLARNRKKQPALEPALEKLRLTPTQTSAAARFKVTFMTIWDPNHKLGNIAFTRELPEAAYPQLGVMVVVNSRIGKDERMQYLEGRYNQLKMKEVR